MGIKDIKRQIKDARESLDRAIEGLDAIMAAFASDEAPAAKSPPHPPQKRRSRTSTSAGPVLAERIMAVFETNPEREFYSTEVRKALGLPQARSNTVTSMLASLKGANKLRSRKSDPIPGQQKQMNLWSLKK